MFPQNLAAISRRRWRMDVQGTPPRDLEARGVADAETTLPGYAYRDDVVDVYQAIHKYVKVITLNILFMKNITLAQFKICCVS